MTDTALEATTVAVDDNSLPATARTTIAYADAERRAVPLLGNQIAVAEQLLGPSVKSDAGVSSFSLHGITAYLRLDRGGACTGVYAVGSAAGSRALASKTWPTDRLLTQAVGKPSTIVAPGGAQSTSRWFAGRVLVVARWENGAAVELRIGDATP